MTWVAVGVGSAAVVGGLISADASSNAADKQVAASKDSIQAQNNQLNQTRADNSQFLKTGNYANTRLAQLLGMDQVAGSWKDQLKKGYADQFAAHPSMNPKALSDLNDLIDKSSSPTDESVNGTSPLAFAKSMGVPNPSNLGDVLKSASTPDAAPAADSGSLLKKFSTDDLNADPVYNAGLKFGLDRGTEGINARATASGMYDSGATLKALTQFGNDYGSTKANDSFNRYNAQNDSIFNKLSGISGTGQTATSQVSAAGTNAVNNISGDITGAGNARAAGVVGGANAWGTAGQGVVGAANNYQNNQILQKLLAQRQSGGSSSSGGYTNDQLYAG